VGGKNLTLIKTKKGIYTPKKTPLIKKDCNEEGGKDLKLRVTGERGGNVRARKKPIKNSEEKGQWIKNQMCEIKIKRKETERKAGKKKEGHVLGDRGGKTSKIKKQK